MNECLSAKIAGDLRIDDISALELEFYDSLLGGPQLKPHLPYPGGLGGGGGWRNLAIPLFGDTHR